ncbi:unnamed protein product [Auanema sp. JU1783]|nr:unnamed protein product [Auanema sp. JU1783]
MPKDDLELISLPGRGRAESIRMMLVFCGQQFNDTRLTIQQWKGRRKLQGFNDDTKLPVMKINKTKTLIGVIDISRYIALHYGLYGKSSADQEKINEIINELEQLNSQLNPIIRATLTKNYEQRKASWDLFKQQSLVPQLNIYETKLATSTYLFNNTICWADIALIEMVTRFQCCYDSYFLAHFPNLKSYCDRFEALPTVRPYIQARPEAAYF